jgi:hypothetical protein
MKGGFFFISLRARRRRARRSLGFFVIARLPEGKPRNFVNKRDCFSIVHNDKIRDCEPERFSVQARNYGYRFLLDYLPSTSFMIHS